MRSEQILQTWRTLDDVILSLPEQEVWGLLAYEQAHQRRPLFIKRLFGRANRLRENREIANIMKGLK